MQIRACLADKSIVQTRPASELHPGFDVELAVYEDGGDSIILLMSENKGREIVEELTKQLDKVEAIAQHRKESNDKMFASIKRLGGNNE